MNEGQSSTLSQRISSLLASIKKAQSQSSEESNASVESTKSTAKNKQQKADNEIDTLPKLIDFIKSCSSPRVLRDVVAKFLLNPLLSDNDRDLVKKKVREKIEEEKLKKKRKEDEQKSAVEVKVSESFNSSSLQCTFGSLSSSFAKAESSDKNGVEKSNYQFSSVSNMEGPTATYTSNQYTEWLVQQAGLHSASTAQSSVLPGTIDTIDCSIPPPNYQVPPSLPNSSVVVSQPFNGLQTQQVQQYPLYTVIPMVISERDRIPRTPTPPPTPPPKPDPRIRAGAVMAVISESGNLVMPGARVFKRPDKKKGEKEDKVPSDVDAKPGYVRDFVSRNKKPLEEANLKVECEEDKNERSQWLPTATRKDDSGADKKALLSKQVFGKFFDDKTVYGYDQCEAFWAESWCSSREGSEDGEIVDSNFDDGGRYDVLDNAWGKGADRFASGLGRDVTTDEKIVPTERDAPRSSGPRPESLTCDRTPRPEPITCDRTPRPSRPEPLTCDRTPSHANNRSDTSKEEIGRILNPFFACPGIRGLKPGEPFKCKMGKLLFGSVVPYCDTLTATIPFTTIFSLARLLSIYGSESNLDRRRELMKKESHFFISIDGIKKAYLYFKKHCDHVHRAVVALDGKESVVLCDDELAFEAAHLHKLVKSAVDFARDHNWKDVCKWKPPILILLPTGFKNYERIVEKINEDVEVFLYDALHDIYPELRIREQVRCFVFVTPVSERPFTHEDWRSFAIRMELFARKGAMLIALSGPRGDEAWRNNRTKTIEVFTGIRNVFPAVRSNIIILFDETPQPTEPFFRMGDIKKPPIPNAYPAASSKLFLDDMNAVCKTHIGIDLWAVREKPVSITKVYLKRKPFECLFRSPVECLFRS